MNPPARPHLLGMLAGLFLAVGLVLSSIFATTAWLKVRNTQFVTVKGSARKDIKADLVVWRGGFSVEAADLLAAQRELKIQQGKVSAFLSERGFTNFLFTPIGIDEVVATLREAEGLTRQRTVGYRLTQTVRVESSEVERISELDSDSTALVEQGIVFTTQSPAFIYTRAGEVKVEMLAEATKDARVRADQIAAQGGRGLARLHDASMGVMQITPRYSGQFSWDGANDTSSVDKTITAVVTATFALK